MERQMWSFSMSQSTMMIMIGISQCAATILLCNVASFCALHTFARFVGVGTWYWDCVVPNCTLLSYIVVHFKSTPQLCTLWAYQVTISRPFICHTLLLCDLFIWWTPSSKFACLGLSGTKGDPDPMMWQFSMIQSKLDKGYQEISCPKRRFCVKAYKCIKYYSLNPVVAKRSRNP